MKIFNYGIIKKNIKSLNDFNLKEEDILSKKIDKIYSEIIKYLIINKQLIDSEKTDNLIREIDLPSINLTKVMFDELSSTLINDKDYIKFYIIENFEDLFVIQKIDFYYILLKYILKSNYYIYQIPFLLETRNKIRRIIKKNIEAFNTFLNNHRDKDKIIDVLRYFIEFDYYKNKSIKVRKDFDNELKVRKDFDDDSFSFKDFINKADNISFCSSSSICDKQDNSGRNFYGYDDEEKSEFSILEENNKSDIIFKILTKSSFSFEFMKVNDNKIIKKFSDVKIGDIQENINFETIKGYKSKNEILNNNYKKLLQFIDYVGDKLVSDYLNNFSFKVTFNFNSKSVEQNIFVINCMYGLNNPNENFLEFNDCNIFQLKELKGLENLIFEINGRID